jgi:hypothetical protein
LFLTQEQGFFLIIFSQSSLHDKSASRMRTFCLPSEW